MMPGMNTHIDIQTEYGRAETLKSLSLQPALRDVQPPKPMLRRFVLPACLSVLIFGSAAVLVFHWSNGALPLDTILPEPELAASGTVTASRDARLAERSTVPLPTAAGREITGSGFVVAPGMTAVFAKYEGRITRIAVAPGDRVEAGDVLATLEDAGAGFALEQAKAAKLQAELMLAARQIDLAQAHTQLDRTEILAARNAVSRQAHDDARTTAERAANAVAQARQSLGNADLSIRVAAERVAELTVRAPLTGTVTRLDARVGDTVLARIDSVRESQSILTITDTENLVIDAEVAETAIAALKPGLRGEAVLDGFPNQPFAVRILRLAPVVSAEKGTVTLRLSLDRPPDGIRPNMAARIRITLDETGENKQ